MNLIFHIKIFLDCIIAKVETQEPNVVSNTQETYLFLRRVLSEYVGLSHAF